MSLTVAESPSPRAAQVRLPDDSRTHSTSEAQVLSVQ